MEEQQKIETEETEEEIEQKNLSRETDGYPEVISSWYLLDLIKPIIREEIIAQCRYDRSGIRMKFCNGQKFRLAITEIK